MKNYIWLFTFLISAHSWSTTFAPVDTSVQINEAEGIIIGQYLRSKSIRIEDNSIVTQMVFKMEREYGLRSDFFGMDEVIVHYPGGTIDGITTKVDGVPAFVVGEKVALYTKNSNNRYWGMNLGFGSYRVINYGKEIMLVNYIFPNDAQIGQVKLMDFEKMIKSIKGSSLKVVQSAQYLENPDAFNSRRPSSTSEGKNRTIASKVEESENTNEPRSINALWLLGLLAFFGGLFRMTRQKKV